MTIITFRFGTGNDLPTPSNRLKVLRRGSDTTTGGCVWSFVAPSYRYIWNDEKGNDDRWLGWIPLEKKIGVTVVKTHSNWGSAVYGRIAYEFISSALGLLRHGRTCRRLAWGMARRATSGVPHGVYGGLAMIVGSDGTDSSVVHVHGARVGAALLPLVHETRRDGYSRLASWKICICFLSNS